MKATIVCLILINIFFSLPANAAKAKAVKEYWWQLEFHISVEGNYNYSRENKNYDGKYSFEMLMTAAMELDFSKDYIVYQGTGDIVVRNWQEKTAGPAGKDNIIELKDKIKPAIILNYVLKEGSKIYFDFELGLNPPAGENYKHLAQLILPRSALNKFIHPKDKYNKNVVRGTSNKVSLREKAILKNHRFMKAFKWQWQRSEGPFSSYHSAIFELIINKQEKQQ